MIVGISYVFDYVFTVINRGVLIAQIDEEQAD